MHMESVLQSRASPEQYANELHARKDVRPRVAQTAARHKCFAAPKRTRTARAYRRRPTSARCGAVSGGARCFAVRKATRSAAAMAVGPPLCSGSAEVVSSHTHAYGTAGLQQTRRKMSWRAHAIRDLEAGTICSERKANWPHQQSPRTSSSCASVPPSSGSAGSGSSFGSVSLALNIAPNMPLRMR